jgi:hypothetical protein
MRESAGLTGWVEAVVTDAEGNVVDTRVIHNLITTAGDEYYAKMGAALVGTPNAAQPTKVTGMKLGTGTTAAAKSGAASYIGTYISGSNQAFDTSYPQTSAVGSDAGWYVTYRAVWAAGDSTNSAISEVVVCNDSATDDGGSAAECISRAVFSPVINKGASDTLTVTWNHKMLGA